MFGEAAGLSRQPQSLPYNFRRNDGLDRFRQLVESEGVLHAGEHGYKRIADLSDDDNDGDTDAGGDETIFDGRHARFIMQKREKLGHDFRYSWY